jgi:ferredoxin-NADP reductase/Na+-translocating ferredoxin:NAD+ oxidoreductase RnfD subunit
MFKFVDNFLNKTTMYRLVLYCLMFLWAVALVFSFLNILPYDPLAIMISAILILFVCWLVNIIFAKVFEAPVNVESVYITALILMLIVAPLKFPASTDYLVFLGWAALWAIASKFIFAIKRKHVFNPAAFAVVLMAFALGQSANWWIGTLPMMPFVLVTGLLIVKKLIRFDLVWSFFIAAFVAIVGFSILKGGDPVMSVWKSLVDSPLLFFAFIMLTEPLTTPPTKTKRILYGALVGLLFAPAVHIGSVYSTPELALLVGNIFSYIISPKQKLILVLKDKKQIAPDIDDFIFSTNEKFNFKPGQYLEWTLGHKQSDNRGNRRYFTLASSPTEEDIRIGIKFYEPASSFKIALGEMKPGDKIIASQLAGDFTLPKDKNKKLVFIAGGIGITPFRSMIKYLIDKNEQREITLLYSNRHAHEIVYQDVFNEAWQRLGIRTLYTLTDMTAIPADWQGAKGKIDAQMIMREIPDYKERFFYLSGPRSMVTAFEQTLVNLGVNKKQIKTDFFPGFA